LGVCDSGPEIEIDTTYPLAPPCPLDIAHKDKEWNKDESKWQCKMDNCIIAYVNQTFGGAWLSGRKGQT
jgi:hypothetical protein